jgi:hypothetical protein
MTPAEFSKSLLESARTLDVPAAGARTRALAQLGASIGGAAGAGAGAAGAATAGTKLGVLAWSLVAAAAVAAGAGSFALSRVTTDEPRRTSGAAVVADPAVASATRGAGVPPVQAPPAGSLRARTDDDATPGGEACTLHTLADAPPATCSHVGKIVPFELRNGCAADVDVFWVDYECHEVFHKRMAHGETWFRTTHDAHVWRIRDHATHALLKEYSAQRVPGAPEIKPDSPTRMLPDVVLRASDAAVLSDAPPAVCSGAGFASKFTVKNERDEQVVLMWVGLDCKEAFWQRIEPKHSQVVSGRDADAWRIRDARTGALLVDIAPDAPDTTTYITVP